MSVQEKSIVRRSATAGSAPDLPEVPGYELVERIGKGGMGEVFLARQVALGRLVAIKFLIPAGESDPAEDLERFRREAKLMARVSHPNILSIFDSGEANGRPYLVMEYVEGGDLRRLMRPGEPVPPCQVLSIVVPVAEALGYLHRHGIIHRDLKPENILLHDGRNPRVSDFGIAVLRAGTGGVERTTKGVGTLGYIAPEQHYRLKVDERADQYSLAALAYEMLTGHLPLGIFKPPSELNSSLPPAVDATIGRGLEESPKDRFPTVREFGEALEAALATATAGSPPATPRRRPLLSLVGIALAAVVAVVGIVVATVVAILVAFPPPRPLPQPSPQIVLVPHPNQAGVPPQAAPVAKGNPPADPGLEWLKKRRAGQIWTDRGAPIAPDADASKRDWEQAVIDVEKWVEVRAYQLWKAQGEPQGEAGEAVREPNRVEAIRQLAAEFEASPPAPPAKP